MIHQGAINKICILSITTNFMTKFYLQIILLTLLTIKGFSQGLYDDQQKIYLLNSGKSKVKVFSNNHLTSIWHVDSSERTITIHNLEPSTINPNAPKYDSKFSTRLQKKYFFSRTGIVDSILITEYAELSRWGESLKTDTISDTMVIIYTYPLLKKWVMNRKKYLIRNGQKKLFSTDYFGYDSQTRLVLIIQDEGRVQFFYSFNDKGQIEKETVLGATILYKYNNLGQKVSRESDGQKIEYEYNENQLLKQEIETGNNTKIRIYEYD